MSDDAVTTSPAPEATPVFRPGEIVAIATGSDVGAEHLFGEVIPRPIDAYEADGVTWVRWRRFPAPQPEYASDLVRVDTTRATRNVLALLAEVGIQITRHEAGISPEVAALICDDDEDWPGLHDYHANALVLWFETMDDVEALGELEARGPSEFGCNWPSVYGAGGVRALIEDGPIIRAVHLADLPDLADLLRRELDGEFGGDPASINKRWAKRSFDQALIVALAVLSVLAFRTGGAAGAGLGVLIAAAAVADLLILSRRSGPPRSTLDAVRRRSRKAVRS